MTDSFQLTWPSAARPARIVTPFNSARDVGTTTEYAEIAAPTATSIVAGAAGQVVTVVKEPHPTLGYGQYVQILTKVNGVNFLVIYGNLQDIEVQTGQNVAVGDALGNSAGPETALLIVQQQGSGDRAHKLPDVIDPAATLSWPNLRLRPLTNGLRIREQAGTDFEVLTGVNKWDDLIPLEPVGSVLEKVGVNGQWLNVATETGVQGFTAAWVLEAVDLLPTQRILGMNLDVRHPLGQPNPSRMKGIEWVRLNYDVSMESGSTDLNQAFNLYKPAIEMYARAGMKMLLVLTHETFGEGAGYDWTQMDSARWRDLTGKFADFCRRISQQYTGQNLVHAYQIWNEQDTPPEVARAAVPIPPGEYANLLAETIKAIRSVDAAAQIITGGHASGPGSGVAYARATLNAMPADISPDGIAFHPYGRGAIAKGDPYSAFGTVADSVNLYGGVLPGKPVWITEWGVLDLQGQTQHTAPIATYASNFLTVLETQFAGRVTAALWYAWADGMDNGFGLVDAGDHPKQPLYDTYLRFGI